MCGSAIIASSEEKHQVRIYVSSSSLISEHTHTDSSSAAASSSGSASRSRPSARRRTRSRSRPRSGGMSLHFHFRPSSTIFDDAPQRPVDVAVQHRVERWRDTRCGDHARHGSYELGLVVAHTADSAGMNLCISKSFLSFFDILWTTRPFQHRSSS